LLVEPRHEGAHLLGHRAEGACLGPRTPLDRPRHGDRASNVFIAPVKRSFMRNYSPINAFVGALVSESRPVA
jgi:hypothetical protein